MADDFAGMSVDELVDRFRAGQQKIEALMHEQTRLVGHLTAQVASDTAKVSACPYSEIVAEWNERCAKVGMKRRQRAGVLQPKILRIWRQYPDLALWRAAFDACAQNEHWRGANGWRGTLESFLRPAHYDKFFDAALLEDPDIDFPAQGDEQGDLFDTVEHVIDRILSNASEPLPKGYKGEDPRDVRGKDDEEFLARMQALRAYLESDWRFGP